MASGSPSTGEAARTSSRDYATGTFPKPQASLTMFSHQETPLETQSGTTSVTQSTRSLLASGRSKVTLKCFSTKIRTRRGPTDPKHSPLCALEGGVKCNSRTTFIDASLRQQIAHAIQKQAHA